MTNPLSLKGLLALFLLTAAFNTAAVLVWGPAKEEGGDAPFYLGIAQSLARGKGYISPESPWPEEPTYGRMPVWPVIVAGMLKLFPTSPPYAVMRFTAAALMGGIAVVMALLVFRVTGLRKLSLAAGAGFALSPVLMYLSVIALSEIPYMLFLGFGLWASASGNRKAEIAGALSLGLATLTRANMIIAPVIGLAIAVLIPACRAWIWKERARIAVWTACFYLLPGLWILRNYQLTHRFPLISAHDGETFYGGNNSLVAFDLEEWGYWVFPDRIPNQVSKRELARTMNELELNDHYKQLGWEFIRTHKADMPRLFLGKLVRAFAPMPWKPVALTFAAYSYRVLLDLLWLLTLRFWWGVMPVWYLVVWGTLFLLNLVTTLVYYGTFRFTHCTVELFLIPFIVVGLARWRHMRLQGIPS